MVRGMSFQSSPPTDTVAMDIDRRPLHTSLLSLRDWVVAVTLTAVLHLLVVITALLPPGNYFFPFVGEVWQRAEGPLASGAAGSAEEQEAAAAAPASPRGAVSGAAVDADPYRLAGRRATAAAVGAGVQVGRGEAALPLLTVKAGYRSLLQDGPAPRLLPPALSGSTIPAKPDRSLLQEVADDAEEVLLGNVFQDAVPLEPGAPSPLAGEEEFLRRLGADIVDGRLDMGFADFILSAEYYQLARSLLPLGQRPAFSLDEAMARYRQRLAEVSQGMPAQLDAYWLVMLLQRYSDNKYYPENGSGMLLDGLFHRQNDCEGGTKEVLAYLQSLYPELPLGTNRGMLQTTRGDFIGHMQGYIGPGGPSAKILDNRQGLIIETTRIGPDSVVPYQSGEIFPLEDFVARYYPELVRGTPLERLLATGPAGPGGAAGGNIVGTSDHPLKMSYGGSSALLADQLYDLDAIRTQRIANEFQRSKVPSCNPGIDPGKIDRTNLFSNFVTIDRKLRRVLIGHYLADLQYWENEIMPQWRQPPFLATYDDLVGSLVAAGSGQGGHVQVDGDNTVPVGLLKSHGDFLALLARAEQDDDAPHYGTGGSECRERTVLDEKLLGYLFRSPSQPGVFFLPQPGEEVDWTRVVGDLRQDCLAVSRADEARELLAALEAEAVAGGSSLRRELHGQVRARGLGPRSDDDEPAYRLALRRLLEGSGAGDDFAPLAGRQSSPSVAAEPSVAETLARVGRGGLNGGLLWDGVDFLGQAEFAPLLAAYGRRGDLALSTERAQQLAANVADAMGGEQGAALLAGWREQAVSAEQRLAATMRLALLAGEAPAAVSRLARLDLEGRKDFRARALAALLRYGLLEDDARRVVAARMEKALQALPPLAAVPAAGASHPPLFVDLAEVVKALVILPDRAVEENLRRRLQGELTRDLATGRQASAAEADYGLVFNKLSLLLMMSQRLGQGKSSPLGEDLWRGYFLFAAERPVGKLMLAPLRDIAGEEEVEAVLATTIAAQIAALDRLRVPGGQRAESLREAGAVLGVGNVVARLLPLLEPLRRQRLAAGLGGDSRGDAWYLERLHRRAAPILLSHGAADGHRYTAADPLLDFYRNDRVRESFALLAYFQEGGVEPRFRRSQDLSTIKDPGSLKVIEGERRITRQDMSLLTLALNPGNSPAALSRSWGETLQVIGRHQGLTPLDPDLRRYLFAPHYPYLVDNDSGFFFSPETVADLHNADRWGGRNDILLSSYLHFRHLPQRLPEWLERAAWQRSEWELTIIKKFEQQTFLPMILECDSDSRELPQGLFRAKWEIRKPFGEDIFPGTLLLLRLGYLEITAAGDIVRTAKHQGG